MITIIEASESVTVRCAPAFASRLLTAARAGGDVMIDVGALAECDLSFVQLILALRAHVKIDGATVSLSQPAGTALRALLNRAGLGEPNADDAQFWFHGERAQ